MIWFSMINCIFERNICIALLKIVLPISNQSLQNKNPSKRVCFIMVPNAGIELASSHYQ